MPRVRLLTSMAGTGFSYIAGAEPSFSAEACRRMIAAGIAEAVEGEDYGEPGPADVPPENQAGKPKPQPKPRPKGKATPAPPPAGPPGPPVPVNALDLEPSTVETLKLAGLATVADVRSHADLTTIAGIGPATAAAILRACDAAEAAAG